MATRTRITIDEVENGLTVAVVKKHPEHTEDPHGIRSTWVFESYTDALIAMMPGSGRIHGWMEEADRALEEQEAKIQEMLSSYA